MSSFKHLGKKIKASFRSHKTQADTTDTTEIRADTSTATIENSPESPTVPMQDITRRTLDTTETSGGAPGTVKTRADALEARMDTTETRGDALQTRIDTTGTGADTPEARIVPLSVQIQDPVRGTEFVDDGLTPEMARNRSTDVRDDPFTLETAILNAEITPEVTEKEDQLSGSRHNKSKGNGKGVTSTASGSAGRPRNPLVPDHLQTKDVYRWSYDDVVAFLSANLETWELEDAQYQIFKKEKIGGKSLLLLTKEDFLIRPFELPLGSALAIVLIVRDLKKAKGIDEFGAGMAPQAPQGLPSVLKRKLEGLVIPPKRRRFAANEAYPKFNFFIEPKILENLGSNLLQRQFCLLFGHRQSGKTTICQALIRWFHQNPEKFRELAGGDQDDFAIYVATFDSAVRADQGPKVFWQTLCRNIYSLDESRRQRDNVMDSVTFKNFFSKHINPSSKPVILIIDEASRLTSVGGRTISEATKEVTDEFVSALRSLRNANDYSLHAVALVGTESIRELLIAHNKPGSSSQVSPFTSDASWMTDRFTKAEVNNLFDQFAMDINVEFESADISADIFDLTLGHKGLVGCCGSYIQQTYEIQTAPIKTVDEWKKTTTIELRRYILNKEHYASMMRSLDNLTPECKFILTEVLRYGTHEVNTTKDATKYLLAEGMVSVKEEGEFKSAIIECSAPILRGLMLSSIVLPTIRLSLSVPDEKKLDPQWLLARTIENLCVRHLYSQLTLNNDDNPSEYAFQSEFATIFRNLVPLAYPLLRYKILVEVKERDEFGRRDQRLDILVRNGNSLPSYGFELVVAASKKEFDEHCVRAEKYGELHGCQMFMVNLCPKATLRKYFGERSYDLTPVNVVIDLDHDEWKGIIGYAKIDELVLINGFEWNILFNIHDM